MSTLGHQYDNSLVSNAFGFLRLPMNFQPYDSDADWVITGVPFDMKYFWSCGWSSRSGSDPSGFDESGLGTQPLPVEFRHA